ncbi:hypothetical protein GEMRC1_011904 [Eukaryota sp. GEM-RC1]
MITLSNNDSKAAASLRRRQQLDEERARRIHDDKCRTIGVDVEALNQQIEEKNQLRDTAALNDFLYDKQLCSLERQLLSTAALQSKAERDLLRSLQDFRVQHQKPEFSDTYDLQDHRSHHNEVSLFEKALQDPSLPIPACSAVKFDGEDLGFKERTRRQQEELKSWISTQLQIKQDQMERQALEDALYDQKLLEMINQVNQLQDESNESCRQSMMNLLNTNLQLTNEMDRRRAEEKQIDQELSQMHADTVCRSTLMTEDLNATVSVLDSNRKVPYNFKGMTEEEVQRILEERNKQLEQKQELIKEYNRMHKLSEAQEMKTVRQLELLEREQKRKEKERAVALREELDRQSREKKEKEAREKENLKKELIVGDDFLNSFGRANR